VFISPPLEVLEQRLVRRWLAHGLDEGAAKKRAATNDIPNAKRILEQSDLQAVDIAFC
jgi:pantothenate kinase